MNKYSKEWFAEQGRIGALKRWSKNKNKKVDNSKEAPKTLKKTT